MQVAFNQWQYGLIRMNILVIVIEFALTLFGDAVEAPITLLLIEVDSAEVHNTPQSIHYDDR
jgi:hypothetical protein